MQFFNMFEKKIMQKSAHKNKCYIPDTSFELNIVAQQDYNLSDSLSFATLFFLPFFSADIELNSQLQAVLLCFSKLVLNETVS